jgi:adenylate cyclase
MKTLAAPCRVLDALKDDLNRTADRIAAHVAVASEAAEAAGLSGPLADLARVLASGRRLHEEAALLDDPVADVERSRSRLRHTLATPLNHTIGYCELWLDEADIPLPAGLTVELTAIRDLGRRLLGRLDEALASSTSLAPIPIVVESRPTIAREGGSILVVDDSPENRDLLARRLTREGHAVTLASDGREALSLVVPGRFDLILLDLEMPGLDGEATLRRLKADPSSREVPVIIASAMDDLDGVARCIELGAEDYLLKPFKTILLRARVGVCLEKKRLRDREVDHLRQIERERARADELLRVMLPDEIVAELAQTDEIRPRRFEGVAVLFSDVVGFTSYSERQPPEAIVAALRDVVHEFEDIAERHGVQKIKTIGDAFMAAAGLLRPVENPVLNCVACGLEMIDAARRIPPHWELRVGIHVGSVVAGVVGKRRYLYDLWGDTVNFAARLESSGIPGKIALSTDAWGRVAHHARGESLGLVQIKGKGSCEVFRLDGLNPIAIDAAG